VVGLNASLLQVTAETDLSEEKLLVHCSLFLFPVFEKRQKKIFC
jgi:hypothetical protein